MGSYPSDLTIKINIDPQSAIANLRKIDDALKKGAQGVAAGYVEAAELGRKMVQQMIDQSTKGGRQLETQLRSLEKQTQTLGKTQSQIEEQNRKYMLERIKGLKNQEEYEKRINAVYAERIKFYNEEERKKSGSGGLLFRAGRDIFEGRTAYGIMDLGRAAGFGSLFGEGAAGAAGGAAGAGGIGAAVAGIGTATVALGALTAGLIGIEAAGFRAAKSLGDYATEIKDVELRTGMSAKEVGQFSFAAKMVGQDISIVERLMRGLSQATDDTSMEGEKARKTFERLHLTMVDSITGAMKPTAQMLEEIGTALAGLPAGVERDAAGIAMFKKIAVEAVPFTTELAENLKIIKATGWGPNDAEIARLQEYHKAVVMLETAWGELRRDMLEPVAATFNFSVKWLGKVYHTAELPFDLLGQMLTGGKPTATDTEMLETGGWGYGGKPSDDQMKKWGEATTRAIARNDERVAVARSTDEHRNLVVAQKQLDTLEASLKTGVLESTQEDVFKQVDVKKAEVATIKAKIEADNKYKADQKTIVEALRKAELDSKRKPLSGFELPAEAELRKALEMDTITPAQKAAFERFYNPRIEEQKKQQGEKFQRQMLATEATVAREMGRARMGGIEPVNIRQLGEFGVTREDIVRDIGAQEKQRKDEAMRTFEDDMAKIKAEEFEADDRNAKAAQQREVVAAKGKLALAQLEAEMATKKEMSKLDERADDLAKKHVETMSKLELASQEDTIKHEADLARKRAELRFKGDSPAASIAEEYRIATVEAEQLFELEMRRIERQETGYKKAEDQAIALNKLHREDEAAAEEAQLKMAEMVQKQLDTIKGKVEPLYHTLFTNPKQFGSQLRSTIQEAALHPIVSGMSELTARALHPLIYGAGGTGGIAGAFGELFGGGGAGLKDLKLTARKAVPVEVVGGPSPSPGGGWSGPMGGWGPGGTPGFVPGPLGLGGGGTGWSGPMGGWGPSGTSVYDGGYNGGGGTGMGGGGFWPSPWTGPGGTPGFAPGSLGLSSGATYGGGLRGIAGIGRGLLQNLRVALGQAKQSVHGETPGQDSLNAVGAEGMGSKFSWSGLGKSPLARAGAGTVGMMLAQAGILGNQRGTGYGVLEGTFGGAGVGFAMGGPVGAAIGAGVGLGISMGEVIAGVESPRNEAKRLAISTYHISVNNSTADQIVAIANQSYGGRVSIAVRSPEVRHMLGLYAAGTGQASRFAQGATEAHGASLVESGGSLFQQATYQYGNPYSYGSSLPVYGGGPTQSLSAPGGNLALSLNIGGQDAAKFLTGNVVSPEIIQSQYASAMSGSAGRVPQALMMSSPGSIAS